MEASYITISWLLGGTLHTRRYCILVYSVLGEGISYGLPVGPVPALTSDSVYPAILYHDLFGPEKGC